MPPPEAKQLLSDLEDIYRRHAMLCTPADRLPVGEDWVYELKYDGARALVVLDPRSGRGDVYARDGTNISAQFPEIAALHAVVPEACLLDGELVCWDADGKPDFGKLSRRLHSRQAWLVTALPVCFVAFDVLWAGTKNLASLPWMQRRIVLASLMPADHPCLRKSQTFEDGPALWRLVVEQGLEGVVAKRKDSTYQPDRRSPDWIKVKAFKEATVTVDTYEANPAGITAIRTADGFRVQVAGTEGTRLRARLDTAPQTINIQYLEETDGGRYRMPTYRGLAPP